MEKRTQQGKLTNLEIASFCSEMAMILKSGISSLEGVDLLREDAQTKAEKELLDEIYQSVMDTGRLDQALEETKVFPEYLIRMTQIGEETGTLDEVMESLAEHYDREEAIRRSVRSAISYPLLMIGMMLVIIIILMTKVMPVFDQVFRQFGQEMTGFSRGILLAGNALSRYSAVFAVLVFASTQFTKQHYIIDVFAGAAIAELSYFIGTHTNFYKKIWRFFDKVNNVVFGRD